MNSVHTNLQECFEDWSPPQAGKEYQDVVYFARVYHEEVGGAPSFVARVWEVWPGPGGDERWVVDGTASWTNALGSFRAPDDALAYALMGHSFYPYVASGVWRKGYVRSTGEIRWRMQFEKGFCRSFESIPEPPDA